MPQPIRFEDAEPLLRTGDLLLYLEPKVNWRRVLVVLAGCALSVIALGAAIVQQCGASVTTAWVAGIVLLGLISLALTRSLIAIFGRGKYTHAAIADWNLVWMCNEVREFYGGRCVSLQSQVEQWPSRIMVFRPRLDEASAARAARVMRQRSGCRYSWRGILHATLTHSFGLRLFFRTDCIDSYPTDRMENITFRCDAFCSWAVAEAYRVGGGFDPVPELADRMTEPSDLAQTSFFFPVCGPLIP